MYLTRVSKPLKKFSLQILYVFGVGVPLAMFGAIAVFKETRVPLIIYTVVNVSPNSTKTFMNGIFQIIYATLSLTYFLESRFLNFKINIDSLQILMWNPSQEGSELFYLF